jgi:phage terminase large subunit-like protein
MWDLSCPDWQERIKSGRSLLPDLPLNREPAERAVKYFNRLRLPDVIGTPRMEVSVGEWQRDIVRALFGSWFPEQKHREIREILAMVPKKSSKTTGSAAIMVDALLMNERPRAEFLLVAPTQKISNLSFAQATGMIEADPVLVKRFKVQENLKRITYLPTDAFLEVKSFDPKVVTGTKPVGILLDEIHVMGQSTFADRVIGQLRGGIISQPEGFLLIITTQSERPPAGVWAAELAKARAVRDGRLQAPMLPLLYEFPPGVDWENPDNWPMVMPNNGFSVSADRLIPDFHAAKAAGPAEFRRWASQHLNIEVGLALLSDRWAGADFWEEAAEPTMTLDDLIERSDLIVGGIDGGGLDDLLGLSFIGREKETRRWLHWAHAWAADIVLERRKNEAPMLRDLEARGDLEIVPSLPEDIDGLVAICQYVDQSGKLHAVGVDPVGIGAIVDGLASVGISDDRVIGISQGWRMSGAIKTVERKVADGTFVHCGQKLMSWCVGAAKVEPKGNALTITKQGSGAGKIDALMATFDAAALMATNPEPKLVQHEQGFVLL